ncbi:hypothetical protein D8674_006012 [Pyrus ussuriensis x Pyrus communis]|uniref:BED-type domain-containing protein n=1 Tax=Pyrus ussuriensis x Pyrus communis TaxID=2448454 RepID=A0A5N5FT42_9ROSA|nr:hypothetical protein D8674_006012 [Pyrus ussuriensis x Pyrus communis]
MAGTVSSGASNPMSSVKCKLCKKVLGDGIYRMKQHKAYVKGNVAGCTKSSDEDKAKCNAALDEAKKKKRRKKETCTMKNIQHDLLVMDAMFTYVEKFFPDDFEVQNRVINIEMPKYKNKDGGFGKHLVEIGCVQNDDNYDLETELGLGMDGEKLKVDSSLKPRRFSRNVEVRDLHEEDFVSDKDKKEEGGDEEEIEFESEMERVLERCGEEEIEA